MLNEKKVIRSEERGARNKELVPNVLASRFLVTSTSNLAPSAPLFRASRLAPRASTSRASSRNGVLLLVVLSMLVLFMMLGTAFVISAKQSSQASKALSQAAANAASPMRRGDLLDEALNQLVRDTNNPHSAMRFHSLLRDMYGSDWISIGPNTIPPIQLVESSLLTSDPTYGPRLMNTFPMTGGQLTWAVVQFLKPNPPALPNPPLSMVKDYYNGLLFTVQDKDANEHTMRVVGYNYVAVTAAILGVASGNDIAIFTLMPLDTGQQFVANDIKPDHRAWLNGRPFNGTGAGYNRLVRTGAALTGVEMVDGTDRPIALTPNAAFFNAQNAWSRDRSGSSESYFGPNWGTIPAQQPALFSRFGLAGLGGSDESYDAVDYQNMPLAMMPLNPVEPVGTYASIFGSGRLQGIPAGIETIPMIPIPSFQRPALINFWNSQLGSPLVAEPNILRKVLMRPNWLDHPKFSGSNPEYKQAVAGYQSDTSNVGFAQVLINRMIYGPWDVDNDNDGVRDSVWIDFGAPIVQRPDGTRVKPLAAILCVDMDGRLNLNAHGSLDLADKNNPEDDILGYNPPPARIVAGGTMSNLLARGQGYGPADINLDSVLADEYNTMTQNNSRFDEILQGFDPDNNPATQNFPGRYGFGGALGNDGLPGKWGKFDLRSQMRMQGFPKFANVRSAYSTPPDMRGRYPMGIDNFGQPVYEMLNGAGTFVDSIDMATDAPYEQNLSLDAPRGVDLDSDDNSFSLAEMERILRAFDADSGTLPPRLWELAGEFKSGTTTTNPTELNQWRNLLTTDSYDLPVPNVTAPKWMYYGPDGAPGKAGTDDDGNGKADDAGEIGWPGSDDFTPNDIATILGKPPVSLSIVDLLRFRLQISSPSFPTPVPPNQLSRMVSMLLSPELADGLRMDINRPLGNGRDDNNNGVVDEPGEPEGAFWRMQSGGNIAPTDINTPALNRFTGNDGTQNGAYHDAIDRDGNGMITQAERGDTDGDGTISPVERVALDNFRRQWLARHLYVLAMTLVDPFNTKTIEGKAKSRRLAQWAINVVDYRDADNCMTPFEYDPNPFDGWQPDGNLATINDLNGPDGNQGTLDDAEVIWGSERPELLITETVAWHDRRTEDHTDAEPDIGPDGVQPAKDTLTTDGKDPDFDFDQLLRPRGAAFIELYNPWPASPGANADTHAIDNAGNDLGVDLARTHAGPSGSPVWRIAVQSNKRGTTQQPLSSDDLLSYDPDDPAPKLPQNQTPLIDRTVYFSGFDPGYQDDGVAFFNGVTANPNFAVGPVRPGRYMLVGSGDDFDGDGIFVAPIGDLNPQMSGTTLRRIELEPGNSNSKIRIYDPPTHGSANPMTPPKVNSQNVVDTSGTPICDVALINQTRVSTKPQRFTISEPAYGYPDTIPGKGSSWYSVAKGASNGEGYYGYGTRNPSQPYPFDTPLDNQVWVDRFGTQKFKHVPEIELATPGTRQAYRWIHLQRLANPTLPWNPESGKAGHDPSRAVNPYLTVDSSLANLTVFNGRNTSETINGAPMRNVSNEFASVERGWKNDPATFLEQNNAKQTDTSSEVNPWAVENSNLRNNTSPADSTHFMPAMPTSTLGFLNAPFAGATPDRFTPAKPFPWLAWNNRPFVSEMEVMQVPAMRSSLLLRTFSIPHTNANPNTNTKEKYQGLPNGDIKNFSPDNLPDGAFGHLQNFFRYESGGNEEVISGLYRVLDYLQVPSPFVGTETWMNPTMFGAKLPTVSGTELDANDVRYMRQPPFNRISTYRDPGQVNLNTIVDARVWDGGILQRQLQLTTSPWNPTTNNYLPNSGHTGPLFINTNANENGFVESRRGYPGNTTVLPGALAFDDSMLLLNPTVPTFFANPFRAADAGDLVPLGNLQRPNSECAFLRRQAFNPGLDGQWGNPGVDDDGKNGTDDLGEFNPTNDVVDNDPLFASTSQAPYNNTDRNAYFRYQPMTRLANLTTTRSNVYAVWITIGFFEVEALNDQNHKAILARFGSKAGTLADARTDPLFGQVYPDSYMFGKEAGSDTGDVQRLREFAIVDRTIPVAFEPGKNHNTERTIRLRRRIE